MNKQALQHPDHFATVGIRPEIGTGSKMHAQGPVDSSVQCSQAVCRDEVRTADTVASCRYGHLIQQRSPATVAATLAAVMRCPPNDSCSGCSAEQQAVNIKLPAVCPCEHSFVL